MEIYFTFESAPCDQYTVTDGGEKSTIIKVMIPRLVLGNETDGLKLISGCSFYKECRTAGCDFSQAAREKPKTNPKPKPKA